MGPGLVEQGEPEGAPFRRLPLKDIVSWSTAVGFVASFTTVFALGVRESFYPVFLKGLGYPAAVTGAMMSTRGIVSFLSRFSLGPLVRMARDRFNLLCLCLAVLAFAIGTTFLCRTVPLLVVNSIVVGASFGMAIPLTQAMVFGSVPPGERGIAMGIRMTGNRLAQFSSPVLFGIVTQAGGISAAFGAGGSLMLLITGILFLTWGRLSAAGRAVR
jgi:predicted MFS family arabinose efflux permease